jgi:predicted RNase H-like nuclease (RuvC/YqgF family)
MKAKEAELKAALDDVMDLKQRNDSLRDQKVKLKQIVDDLTAECQKLTDEQQSHLAQERKLTSRIEDLTNELQNAHDDAESAKGIPRALSLNHNTHS